MNSRIGGFHELCRGSDLPALIEYVKLHNITAEDARSWNNHTLRWACLNGYFDIALKKARTCFFSWLIEHFGFTREDICDRVRKEIMDQLDWEPSLGPKSAVKLA